MSQGHDPGIAKRALDYVIQQLDYGFTLDELLRKRLELRKGRVYTPLEPDKEGHLLDGFDCVPSYDEDDRLDELVDQMDLFRQYLRKGGGRMVVLESVGAPPSEPWVSRFVPTIMTHGEEIYHFMFEEDVDRADLEQVLQDASAPCLEIGALTRLPPMADFSHERREISLAELTMLADNTEKLYVSAYDGEGYLIWDRGPSSCP